MSFNAGAAHLLSLRPLTEVDERGYIYIVDRANTGVHILQLSGDGWKVLQ